MRFKIILFFCLIISFLSCNSKPDSANEDEIEQKKSQVLTEQEVSSLKYIDYILDAKTQKVITDWSEHAKLQDIVVDVKKGDLSYFENNDKEIKLFMRDLKANMPLTLKSESILSRILVLETKFFKLESLSNLSTTTKEELLASVKEFLVSFSYLSFQMNKKIEFDSRTIVKP